MRKNMHRFFSVCTAIAMCICTLATTVSAAESESVDKVEATCYNLEVTSDGVSSITDSDGNVVPLSVLSSISGYKNGTLSGDPCALFVFVNATGWGGMGITVKTTSTWNGYMSLDVAPYNENSITLQGVAIPSNGERQYHNLSHGPNPGYYFFSFRGIPSGESVGVEVWIYG